MGNSRINKQNGASAREDEKMSNKKQQSAFMKGEKKKIINHVEVAIICHPISVEMILSVIEEAAISSDLGICADSLIKNDRLLRSKPAREDAAQKAYDDAQAYITIRLDEIRDKLTKHGSADRINWSHAGDLNHVAAELNNINNFLGGYKK